MIELPRTPSLVLNLDALERNLERMARDCREAGIALRPHAKTHKSPWIASRQMQLGAVGICTAKLGEAEVMVRAGISDVLITTELVPTAMERVLTLATMASVSVVVDDAGMAIELGRRAHARGLEIRTLVDINIGANRTGIEPGAPTVELGTVVAQTSGLHLAGLQAYEGHCQGIVDFDEQRSRSFEAYEQIAGTKRMMEDAGLEVDTVTGSGTGSYRHAIEYGLSTELQPGSYTVMDSRYMEVKSTEFEHALFIVCSVVSTNRTGAAIVDAGWKTVSVDGGMPVVRGFPEAGYRPAGDEHGRIAGLDGDVRPGNQIWLLPSHCDTTINLFDSYVLVRDDGRIEGELPIAARGKSA